MKLLLKILILLGFPLMLTGQKADFYSAEKFMEDNLSSKIGDLTVDVQWIGGKLWSQEIL